MTDPAMKAAGKVNATGIHTGAIRSIVGGRTDHHEMEVPSGSYVLPADHVSSLGQGNTENGFAVLEHMFPSGIRASNAKKSSKKTDRKAEGGMVGKDGEPVPIMAAGGEYVVDPDAIVKRYGSLEAGHAALDAWVRHQRQKHINTLSTLPGPAQD